LLRFDTESLETQSVKQSEALVMQAPRSSVVKFEIGSVNEIIEVVDNVLSEYYV